MKPKKRSFLDRLRNRYRLVILDDETFEERASFRLTRFNVYILFSTLFVIMFFLITALIILTPLREYLSTYFTGYDNVALRKEMVGMEMRTDSLNTIVQQQDAWIHAVRNMLRGNLDTGITVIDTQNIRYDTINLEEIPEEDIKLRQEIEKEQSYSLTYTGNQRKGKIALSQLNFFPPISGYITSAFNPSEDHYGIDIVSSEDEPIKSILDGHVVLATWTLETGYVIGIQHEYNLVSFYKHNSSLLKKVGNFVRAGDVIGRVGNSGELTSGPHLHFELWYEGVPVNPEDYIIF